MAFQKGKEVAFKLRELLNTMSLEPIVKTSGKTGLHVFLPIRRTIDFDIAREVSEQVGRHLMRLAQGRDAGVERAQAHRENLHGLQHERARQDPERRLLAARRGGAPVSMPLTWDELWRAPARLPDHQRGGVRNALGGPLARRAPEETEPRGRPGTRQGIMRYAAKPSLEVDQLSY